MASPEYRRLGVIGRQRLLWDAFPELKEQHDRDSAAHLTEAAHGTRPKEERPAVHCRYWVEVRRGSRGVHVHPERARCVNGFH